MKTNAEFERDFRPLGDPERKPTTRLRGVIVDRSEKGAALTPEELRKAADLRAEDEPIYLAAEDMPQPPPEPEEVKAPTVEQVARMAAEMVLEIQKNSPAIAEERAPRVRVVEKTVVRDASNRIEKVIERHIEE